MPPGESLVAFSVASVILIAIPGPSVLFVVGRSLSLGRRGGLLSVLGNELGALPLVVAVSCGVGAVVAQSVALFTTVKFVGSAYLIYLGVQAIRHRAGHIEEITRDSAQTQSAWRTLGQGFIVGVTNPKSMVFFVAALPQFVDYHAGHVAAQMITLGVIFVLIAFICDGIWALVAGTARTWISSSPRRLSRIRGAGGGMMIGLGASLAFTGSKT